MVSSYKCVALQWFLHKKISRFWHKADKSLSELIRAKSDFDKAFIVAPDHTVRKTFSQLWQRMHDGYCSA